MQIYNFKNDIWINWYQTNQYETTDVKPPLPPQLFNVFLYFILVKRYI